MIGWNDWMRVQLIKRKLHIIFPLYFIKVSCKILILISMQIYFFPSRMLCSTGRLKRIYSILINKSADWIVLTWEGFIDFQFQIFSAFSFESFSFGPSAGEHQ